MVIRLFTTSSGKWGAGVTLLEGEEEYRERADTKKEAVSLLRARLLGIAEAISDLEKANFPSEVDQFMQAAFKGIADATREHYG